MRIALAQLNYHIGNFDYNVSKIIEHIRVARQSGADLVVFSELAVCGYPPRDFLEFSEFIDLCDEAIKKIAGECMDIACIVGAPSVNPDKEGKDLFNSAYFLESGKVKARVDKTLLPTYDVFDEYRYFEPGKQFSIIEFKGKRIALTICEDLWNISENPLYTYCPMDTLIGQQPDLMINIAASPFAYDHAEEREKLLSDNCKKYRLPLIYVNHIGAQTELIFDGGSLVINEEGEVLQELNYFEEDFSICELLTDDRGPRTEMKMKPPVSGHSSPVSNNIIERIHSALVLGIRDYFHKSGFTKAILGLSGGIDSAVVCCLAAEALGAGNVKAVLMPSKFSSDHSVADAFGLVENLDITHELISIHNIVETTDATLYKLFKGLPLGLTEENMQARIRAVILMALSNKFGYILLNTSNKSENAVGYGTLYGDMCGGLSVLGDVYKTQVYDLANDINREREIIPLNTISKPPSAELRPDQKDSDSLPEYDVLDKILFRYIELRKSSKEIIAQSFDEALVRKVIRLVNTNEYKRHQTPPILRVSPKAFGMGRRMPIVAKYLS